MYLVNLVISAIIVNVCWLYFGSKILCKKVNYKNKKTLLAVFISIALLSITNIEVETFYKIFINYLLIVFLYKWVFKSDISKILICGFVVLIYFFVAEIIFSLALNIIIISFPTLSLEVNKDLIFNPIVNMLISGMAILLSKTKVGSAVEEKALFLQSKIKSYGIVIIVVLGMAVFSNKNFNLLGANYNYILNLILIIIFAIILLTLFKEKEKSTSLSEKYDQLLNYIQKYELELTNKSITIHEFKNQIIAIKGFVSLNNKKANEYIDSIISDIKGLECSRLSGMENIPSGGLKGLIYFKLGDLKEKGINVITNVQPKIKKNFFCLNNAGLYKNILKIIGVYLDNAIEAALISSKKEIIMEIYEEKNISHLILTNTYNSKIELDKLDNVGYSTKGAGRGYGLTLVKNIIETYDNIFQSREVNGDYYTVHLAVHSELKK